MSAFSLVAALPASEHLDLRETERSRRLCLVAIGSARGREVSVGVLVGGLCYLAAQIGSGVP